MANAHFSRQKPKQSSLDTTLRWMPKKILQAQGYYEGNCRLWVPKSKKSELQTNQPTSQIPTMGSPSTRPEQTCQPKESSFRLKQEPKEPTKAIKQKWVIRADFNKKKYVATTELDPSLYKPSTTIPRPKWTVFTPSKLVQTISPKGASDFNSLTIRERATYLQALISHRELPPIVNNLPQKIFKANKLSNIVLP